MRILIIEDDRKTADFVAKGFRESGMVVDVCHDGNEGLDRILIHEYDAAVVDVMLPGLDGLSIIQVLREEGSRTPVLILSAKRSVSERIEGIRAGGDDYMVKPFSFSELVVRVEALVRRSRPPEESESREPLNTLKFADLELDAWKRVARRNGENITLHAKEFGLLEYLMRNQGRVLSKTSILENVYGYNFDPQTNVVDVLVYRLRNKIDKGYDRKLIHTIRGMGYVLKTTNE
ncbi:MAG: response regulator transcription factor [Verrucomicrobiota bacterium]